MYFYDLSLSWLGFEQPTFRMQGKRSTRMPTAEYLILINI